MNSLNMMANEYTRGQRGVLEKEHVLRRIQLRVADGLVVYLEENDPQFLIKQLQGLVEEMATDRDPSSTGGTALTQFESFGLVKDFLFSEVPQHKPVVLCQDIEEGRKRITVRVTAGVRDFDRSRHIRQGEFVFETDLEQARKVSDQISTRIDRIEGQLKQAGSWG